MVRGWELSVEGWGVNGPGSRRLWNGKEAPIPETLNPIPETLNPIPETLNPIPETLNPIPETLNPVPEIRNPGAAHRRASCKRRVVKP